MNPMEAVLGPSDIEPMVFKTYYDVCSKCNSPYNCTCEHKSLKRVHELHWNEKLKKSVESPPPTDEEYTEEITKLEKNLLQDRVPCFHAKINIFSEMKKLSDELKSNEAMSKEQKIEQL